ncbi:fungal-specific transcription factor domain-containing protein [Hypoxylon trugodes]|uniref:fungal-specific transcription factor domain-containing protein n=1 Tax=Hypoxylon trugodes TaxID=326681 RepID=UPI00218F0A54|nr:fungal-specific transcription factor domain-containing protein [Hypoxylon trugodes]KAI1385477.1 fungal-specific transcription factor domain-containing protein [Hypoxylon trugodes]
MAQAHSTEPSSIDVAVEPPIPRRKRLKISVACDTCRARKVKCDGIRPSCGNCLKRINSISFCNYSSNNTHSSSSTTQDIALPTREGASRNSCDDYTNEKAIGVRATPRHEHSPEAPSVPSRPLHMRDPTICGFSPNVPTTSPPTTITEVDSMTTVIEDGESTREYFGSSSASSFTSQIRAAIDTRLGLTTSCEVSNTLGRTLITTAPTRGDPSLPLMGGTDYVLPPRRLADHLLGVYWRYVDPLYPFLDKEDFESAYQSVFNGTLEQVNERTFMATLNIILALSTQLQETLDTEQREHTCKTFFNRAQGLLRLDIWDTGSIELIQYLLILSQYLQSTNNPHQTWMVVGTAIRIAQGLGLHLPETSIAPRNPRTGGLLRRLWHGCILMDRQVKVQHEILLKYRI